MYNKIKLTVMKIEDIIEVAFKVNRHVPTVCI